MKSAFCIFISVFILSEISAFADETSQQVYFYKVNVKNANELQDGYQVRDLVPMGVASVIKQKQVAACIDLHMLFSSSDEKNLLDGDVEILLNTKMSDSVREGIKANVCEAGPSTCAVEITEEVYSLNDLSLDTEVAPSAVQFRPPPKSHSLSGKSMIPKFSEGCDTGKYDDSWEKAAGTPEARKYILDAGVDTKPTWEINLSKKDGTSVFRFGHLAKRVQGR